MSSSTYTVERAATIAAGPQQIYDRIADFHQWMAWSPWEDLDPDQQRTFSGAESGPGAKYAWSGNRKAGKGSMEIFRSSPGEIAIALEFLKPFKSTSTTVFTFTPNGSETIVSWKMTGEQTGPMGLFGKFFNMEKLIGPDFEKGLARLKAVAEEAG